MVAHGFHVYGFIFFFKVWLWINWINVKWTRKLMFPQSDLR
jgi:hypothetical protein